MCTNNYKIECPVEKKAVNFKEFRTEIIVDNEIGQILDSLQKYDLCALEYGLFDDSGLYKATVQYRYGYLNEYTFSFPFRFNHKRHHLKRMLIAAGGFITQEGKIPEIIHFKGMRDIDVYFVLTDTNLIIDVQFLPLEKRLYDALIPGKKSLENLIENTELNYLLQNHISKFSFND
ncbi:hypothetical protein [Chryseobacterium sp. ZHDP1]|uniref:hypothetical protein n=1 Tax=Chryseobacterium sp. ZHDP1 TaxID=2838877 RepID=UPI001BE002CE|nr:hypothetical protein [Chryseobacterium sp. ZHDP1]QWA38869.1 hypothetical protein KKI44_01255 [Chryseobacterium sp. ZHDP1]